MFKLIFKKTNEELIFDTREEAEMCLKLSVMVNNRTTDEIVDYVFENTSCQFCIRRNYGSCHDLVGGCKKYIKDFFLEELEAPNHE